MRGFTIDRDGVTVSRRLRGPVTVSFDDHYVWAFDPVRDGRARGTTRVVPWPEVLRTRLAGEARVRLSAQGTTLAERAVRFDHAAAGPHLSDAAGHRLAVDKMGHLTRVFSATGPDARRHALLSASRLLTLLRDLGYDAHLSYGCLLGAVRDGRMIGHDSDIDLAYLSRHGVPADVIRESYAMERELRERGFRVLRMSGADLKVFAPTDDGRVVHIDIFGAFHVGEVFYQLGGRSGRLDRASLTPASTVTLDGVAFAAPADPDAVLTFLYGPSWRIPDPAFGNDDPLTGIRRLDGWLRGTRNGVAEWNEVLTGGRDRIPRHGSPTAHWMHAELPATAPVAEIGPGSGSDAAWLARQGREVLAYDAAGAALRQTRRRLERNGQTGDRVRALALNDRRAALLAGAELARVPEVSLYARRLLGCLDDEARDHFWLLCSMALRGGGAAYLEFADDGSTATPGEPSGLHRRLDTATVLEEIRARGGRVRYHRRLAGIDMFGAPDPSVTRLITTWSPTPTPHRPDQKESR